MVSTAGDVVPLSAVSVAQRIWTTPRRLVAAGLIASLLAVGLGVLTSVTISAVGNGFTVIGQQAAPQVQTSTDLYFALSDLDAQAANVLLVGTGAALARDRTAVLNLYEQRRIQADHDLDQAAQDAGADSTAQQLISTVIDQLGHYESLVSQAVLVNQQGHDPVGRPSAATLALYQQATDGMRGILPEIQQLITRDHDVLNSTYTAERDRALAARVWVGVLGGVAVLALVGLQVLLRLWQRRRTNPALLLATVLGLGIAIGGAVVLSSAANQLLVAKADAFDSIIALSEARAISDDANADESRYLVDPQRAAQYQQAFLADSQSLLNPRGAGLDQYNAALAVELNAYYANHADVEFAGFFGTEMNNITFPGERAAAESVLATYQTYQLDDRHLRALAAQNLTAAVQYDIGTTRGDSDYAFNQFDTSLVKLIQINQSAFDTAVHDGQTALTGWSLLVPGLGVLLIVGLTVIGLWPRLAEYR